MKRIISLMLALTLSLTTAFASGDTNIDGGGGGMDDGSKTSYWNMGDDGIRVSVIHEPSCTTVAGPMDFTSRMLYLYWFVLC